MAGGGSGRSVYSLGLEETHKIRKHRKIGQNKAAGCRLVDADRVVNIRDNIRHF